jgi:DNA-binding response OmpR family regulator
MLRLEREILSRDGFDIATVSDGLTALEKLETSTYQAIVLDIRLPGLDGYEVARRIRRSKANAATPIIMVTGSGEWGATARSFAAGAVVFVNKPFTAETFRAAVRSAIG